MQERFPPPPHAQLLDVHGVDLFALNVAGETPAVLPQINAAIAASLEVKMVFGV